MKRLFYLLVVLVFTLNVSASATKTETQIKDRMESEIEMVKMLQHVETPQIIIATGGEMNPYQGLFSVLNEEKTFWEKYDMIIILISFFLLIIISVVLTIKFGGGSSGDINSMLLGTIIGQNIGRGI